MRSRSVPTHRRIDRISRRRVQRVLRGVREIHGTCGLRGPIEAGDASLRGIQRQPHHPHGRLRDRRPRILHSLYLPRTPHGNPHPVSASGLSVNLAVQTPRSTHIPSAPVWSSAAHLTSPIGLHCVMWCD